MKSLRLIVHALLLAILAQIGDGIFVAHEGEREYLKQIFLSHPETIGQDQPDTAEEAHYAHGSFDEINADLADMPAHRVLPAPIATSDIAAAGGPVKFSSSLLSSIYRPPSASLS
jgi:hypothetical protein